jgi:hypothetical protein
MKNPTGEKNPIGLFFPYGRKKNPQACSIWECFPHLVHLGEILPLTVSNGVFPKQKMAGESPDF